MERKIITKIKQSWFLSQDEILACKIIILQKISDLEGLYTV